MAMDVDYVVAKQYIEKLEEIIDNLEHMNRTEIADDIIEFVEKMEKKYKK